MPNKSNRQKLATALLASLPMLAIVGATASLSGCGFQLRGYDAPMLFDVAKTAVIIEDNRTAFPLKLPLTKRLEALGVDVITNMTLTDVASNNQNVGAETIAAITVNNVRFKRYELVGVLTEIRLVISADVSYQSIDNGKPITLSNPIQVERSYQYNEASVSTDDQQGDQIREWLYDSLARRITDQYVAIALPKVTPASATTSAQIGKGTGATAILVPKP
ncbi:MULTISPECIES: LPS-assembly lipoprotein LptE [unclassified Psychrobacter]|uniref:LPS-assembly lipoprotein LptE n=1 Tax=Psychrobacter TaxID=497 RepID=UPI0021D83EAF|nr:LPS assembly lipoprotein LptE [Psychrobacter sp. SC65A.3]WAI88499.1 LPS-assembly lipoprotein LptE [Psychrobacter sp. SC65A.3]